MRHDTPEELKRAIDKKAEALKRQRSRSKKLRILLDTRTKKMVTLWGALDDIRRDVGRVASDLPDPGDWTSLVQSVRELVNDYVTLKFALSREAVRAALLEERLREEQEKAPGLFLYVRRWLQRRRKVDGQ
jgi:hypothetical protein